MHRNLTFISLESVDSGDGEYMATYPLNPSPFLIESIRSVGLINPPLMEKKPATSRGGYRIICGFQRVTACKELKISEIPAFVLDECQDNKVLNKRLLTAFFDNSSHRAFNLVEKAHWVAKLHSAFGPEETLNRFLPYLNISPSHELMRRYLLLAGAPEAVKELAVTGSISLKEVAILSECDDADQHAFAGLVAQLHPGINLRREFLHLLHDISQRDEVTMADLLKQNGIRSILDSNAAAPVKIEGVREYLRRKRYPLLSRIEETFEGMRKDLALPEGVQLKPPDFFENDQYKLIITLSETDEVHTIIDLVYGRRDHVSSLIKRMSEEIKGEGREK